MPVIKYQNWDLFFVHFTFTVTHVITNLHDPSNVCFPCHRYMPHKPSMHVATKTLGSWMTFDLWMTSNLGQPGELYLTNILMHVHDDGLSKLLVTPKQFSLSFQLTPLLTLHG